jgi:hypothetical protein
MVGSEIHPRLELTGADIDVAMVGSEIHPRALVQIRSGACGLVPESMITAYGEWMT